MYVKRSIYYIFLLYQSTISTALDHISRNVSVNISFVCFFPLFHKSSFCDWVFDLLLLLAFKSLVLYVSPRRTQAFCAHWLISD